MKTVAAPTTDQHAYQNYFRTLIKGGAFFKLGGNLVLMVLFM